MNFFIQLILVFYITLNNLNCFSSTSTVDHLSSIPKKVDKYQYKRNRYLSISHGIILQGDISGMMIYSGRVYGQPLSFRKNTISPNIYFSIYNKVNLNKFLGFIFNVGYLSRSSYILNTSFFKDSLRLHYISFPNLLSIKLIPIIDLSINIGLSHNILVGGSGNIFLDKKHSFSMNDFNKYDLSFIFGFQYILYKSYTNNIGLLFGLDLINYSITNFINKPNLGLNFFSTLSFYFGFYTFY